MSQTQTTTNNKRCPHEKLKLTSLRENGLEHQCIETTNKLSSSKQKTNQLTKPSVSDKMQYIQSYDAF